MTTRVGASTEAPKPVINFDYLIKAIEGTAEIKPNTAKTLTKYPTSQKFQVMTRGLGSLTAKAGDW
jgi:hypothetical protein